MDKGKKLVKLHRRVRPPGFGATGGSSSPAAIALDMDDTDGEMEVYPEHICVMVAEQLSAETA
eukprot:7193712-Pyramimonas_sp.AAC.1